MNSSRTKERGRIVSYFSGIAKLVGLPNVFLHEILTTEDGSDVGLIIGFDEKFVEALIFAETFDSNIPLYRSRRTFTIPVSEEYIGRVVNGLGQPLDALGTIGGELFPIFAPAPRIIDREEVHEPIVTGIKIIDTVLPIGRGQRELLIGDRNLGKSTIVMDMVLNQKYADPPVFCIYVVCSQEDHELSELIELLDTTGGFEYTTVVAAISKSSFANQYLAPFVGSTIGEYFRSQGKHALIIYDDLSKHAKTYRDISLLLERSPGREAYPGDIFSLHAHLLERAGKLSPEHGSGSLTAIPIIETQEGDITSYIPTNLISITDGQIYLERGLFQKGFLPAINVGLSVSRVGAQAQPPSLREVTGGLRLALAQQKELQKLTQLETVMSQEALKKFARGQLILELLKQKKHTMITWEEQVLLFYVVEQGSFDDLAKERWEEFQNELLELIRYRYSELLQKIHSEKLDTVKENIVSVVIDFKKEFVSV